MIVNNNSKLEKVDQNLINQRLEDLKNNQQEKNIPTAPEQSNEKDRLELSSQAKQINGLVEESMAKPDIREEKVAAIENAISDGTYEIDSKKIAEKLIDEGLGLLE